MSGYNEGYDEGYRAGMQKMREVGQTRIDELEAKLAKAVKALEYSRETILELVNSRYSEAEGTDEDWVGEIDATLAELKEKNT